MFQIRVIVACGLVLALAGPPTRSRASMSAASAAVVDEMQMAVPGVTVVASHRLTNVATATTTDESGRYRFPYLRIGVYEVKATLLRFGCVASSERVGWLRIRRAARARARIVHRENRDRRRGAGDRYVTQPVGGDRF